jgi:hypothetical protein
MAFFMQAQGTSEDPNEMEMVHSVLPADGIIPYLPEDTSGHADQIFPATGKVQFRPTAYFFFRPESTSNYKEAGMVEDTGHLNFYLRGDFGGNVSLPKNIDLVFNLHSYGVYSRSFGPLDQSLSLYEAYVDMKKLDRNGKLSLRFGRMSLGKYGTEILVGDDDFARGRSFESIRFRYKGNRSVHDLIWAQLYQAAPDSVNFDWNHPIFLGSFNTYHLTEAFNFDVNFPYIIDQYNSGYRTSVYMPDARIFGKLNQLRYSAEFIYQGGPARGIITDEVLGKVKAYAGEASIGYETDDDRFEIDLSYYRASGDDDLSDDQLRSYNVLWQNEHRRFGYIDAFKGSNVQAATLHLNWNAGKSVATGIHGVWAQVLEQRDRSTGIAAGPIPADLPSSNSIGIGGDWYLNYYYNQFFNFQLSASVFSPGEYFTAVNGIDETMFRLYLLMLVKI